MTLSNRPALALVNVSVIFGKHPARALPLLDAGKTRAEVQAETGQILGVHDCSLKVEAGELVVLMGLSGSGKSTLLRAVNQLNPIARGAVKVDDGARLVDLSRAGDRQLRAFRTRRIAMVFQQFGLLPWRTVAENVAFGLEVAGAPKAKRQAQVAEQLAMVGLADWAQCRVHELSGGMQQRVGLARAFATQAPILLMDEPFSALDPLIRVRLQDELLELQRRMQRTILFVSHDLDEALRIGNRIVIMQGGRIIQTGAPEAIIQNPATDYVAAFVANMNPLKALRAGAVMRPLTGEEHTAPGNSVSLSAPLMEVLRHKPPGQCVFVADAGQRCGVIDDAALHRALLGNA